MKAPGAGVRMRREARAPPARRGSRPETPLLRWRFDEGGGESFPAAEEDKSGGEAGRKSRRRIIPGVSARKLAAGLWRLHMPEFQIHTSQRVGGFQFGVDHFGGTLDCHHVDRVHGLTDNDMVHSPRSVSDPKHGHLFKKARALIEDVCDELAKEIEEDKAEVEALKRECMSLGEEVEEERRMLQMAEVWREERMQMKLVDAKVMLEDKYSEMSGLVAGLVSLLSSSSGPGPEKIEKAEFLIQVAKSVSMQDVRELTYEPPNLDDIFSMLGEGECSQASKIHTVSPEVKVIVRDGVHHAYTDQIGELLEEDVSEWETVSHQGSSYSPEGSDPSVNNRNFRARSVPINATEWEKEGRIVEIGEVDSARMRQIKRDSSISNKLWKSCPNNGDSYKIVSNGTVFSPYNGLPLSPQDLYGQWSSPDSGKPRVNRAMKGCIEWPRGAQKSSLKARFLEARMGSQKVQLRQVLKHKI
ncbi:Unknown protein [Striga hermonthica]|uniref:Uncharacterized protein n=1 Tax=Striga hermonthica TaxID=68872 RepID=A0A9N7NKS5_STRHE|nr:Unknown protein [Striga hermonthica]